MIVRFVTLVLLASVLFGLVPRGAAAGTALPLTCDVIVAMGGNKLWFKVTNPTGLSQTCNITCNWLDNSGSNHTDTCTHAEVPVGANKFTSCVRPAPLGRPGAYSGTIDCSPQS